MTFSVPNAADAGPTAFPQEAAPQSGDWLIASGGMRRTGVVSGCAVTVHNSGIDKSLDVAAGSVVIDGVQVLVPPQTIADGSVAADGTNPRWSLVQIDTAGVATILPGTAASLSPHPPTYPTIPTDHAILAAVWIPAAVGFLTVNNVVDKRVFVANTGAQADEFTRGLGLFPAVVPLRRTWSAYGGPGQAGGALVAGTPYTLLDTSLTAEGGVNDSRGDYRSSPGVIHCIDVFLLASVSIPWFEETGIEIYYDGQSSPTIRMPLRAWMNTSGCSTLNLSTGWYSYRHRFIEWMSDYQIKQVSFSFKLPIPFSTSVKVVLVTPGTGTATVWSLVNYTLGSNLGFGSAKLRTQWRSRSSFTNSYSQRADVWNTDSSGKWTIPTTDQTTEAVSTSNGTVVGGAAIDCGWGTRLFTTVSTTPATGTVETWNVFNATALFRGLTAHAAGAPATTTTGQITDPLTGQPITLTVASGVISSISPNMYAWVGTECIQITGADLGANTITVKRAMPDPITLAATTAITHAGPGASYPTADVHPGDNINRIIGPNKLVGVMVGTSWAGGSLGQNTLEGPVGVFLDREVGWDLSGTGKGFIGSVGSGGMEDFFGTGWYGSRSAVALAADIGGGPGNGDPDRNFQSLFNNYAAWTRWFHNDPVYGAYALNWRINNGEPPTVGTVPLSTTLYAYTSH